MEQAVLVLNANYEPINVCCCHRAIGLMLTEKASLILNGRGMIRTANTAYPIPSIIRLSRMVHPPHPHVTLSRREIFRRDLFICQYCGKASSILTVDHVIPRHMGGKHDWTNLVTACPTCNHRKGGRMLVESGMVLFKPPKEPPRSASYIFARFLPENFEWENYLNGW